MSKKMAGFALLLALAFAAPAVAQGPQVEKACAECHRSQITSTYERNITHPDSIGCLTCHHIGMSNDPKVIATRRVETCKNCHENVNPAHARMTETNCTSCHKVHEGTAMHPMQANLVEQCSKCHENAHPTHPKAVKGTPQCTTCHSVDAVKKTVLTLQGASLSSTCESCHKNTPKLHAMAKYGTRPQQCSDCHDIGRDARWPESAAAIADRCTSCHKNELMTYKRGGHKGGMAAAVINKEAPTCVTCHNGHKKPDASVKYAATEQCVSCHSNEQLAKKYDLPVYAGGSYIKDYHGATVKFKGKGDVLTCADCHGAHNVAWNDSKVVAQVCQDCHKGASAKLAGAWLGHKPLGFTNKPIIFLAKLGYYVLIPFMLIGLAILILFQLIDQRRKGATVSRVLHERFGEHKHHAMVQRFNKVERFDHLGSALSFVTLVITGLPQTRPDWRVAQWIINALGGIDTTRFIHRVAGFIFVGLLVSHMSRGIFNALTKKRLPVMFPTIQDFFDTFETLKHFVWGTPKPKTGKFDFAEKFEYWGMVLGGTLMAVTGVALVFPVVLTWILPGQFIALFRTLHGLEATFATLVVVLWHSYGVVLRPEVFPLDTTIFTGKMDLHRLKEEHELEYERLLESGEIFVEAEVEEEEMAAV